MHFSPAVGSGYTAAEFAELSKEVPEYIDWGSLSLYELEDTTSGMQTMACSADSCEIVDIT